MNLHLMIVTGASRGLGAALARQWLARDDTALLAISRHPDPALQSPRLTSWALDLTHPLEAAARLEAWLVGQEAGRYASATLVNNAALLTPPGPTDEVEPALLVDSLRVGLEAPVLLSAAFVRATQSWPGVRKVLNISSGLGRRAMAGSAPYCAVKAGLDHFTRAMALDEARRPNGVRTVSLAPGIIDTDMQVQLREGDPSKFPDRDAFVGFKTQGQLATPDEAAKKLLAYLAREDFGHQPVADVREA